MLQKNDELNLKNSIILDTGSTFSSIKNKDPIKGVTTAKDPFIMKANTGSRYINKHAEIPA